MTDQYQIPPVDDDPVLDGYLRSLNRLGPRPGFEDRVLARVWRPAPMFLLVWRDRARAVLTPRRVWAATATMAAGSTAWIVAIGSWLSAQFASPAAAAAWAADIIAPSWNTAVTHAGAWGSLAAARAAELAPASPGALATGLVLAPLVSSAGLYYLWQRTARERARTHAAH